MKTLYIKITDQCNMNCPFCYIKKGNNIVSIEKIKEIYNKFKPKCIRLHGGEPLLYPNLCLEIINTFNNVEYSITSNLTLPISKERQKVIEKCDLSTSYSIDRFSNNNYFDIFLRNVIDISKYKDITLLVTLSRDQLKQSPKDLCNILENIPCKYIAFERLYEDNYDQLLAKQTDEYLKQIMDLIPKEKNVLLNEINQSLYAHIPLFCDTCKKDILTINADNTIQICPNLSDEKITKKRRKQCLSCNLFEYCKEDCLSFKNGCMFPKETFLYIKNGE